MKVLLINQAFYPDLVSSAQHAADLACELAGRGHEVTVVCSRRPYDGAGKLFSARETWRGIRILRVKGSGLGKRSLWRRALDFATFAAACAIRIASLPSFDVVIAMTSPPLIAAVAAVRAHWRGERLISWMLDLNPDEAIAAGKLRPGAAITGIFEAFLRYSLRHSRRIVVMDRFMADRVRARGVEEDRLAVIPPWSHDDAVRYDPEGRLKFQQAFGLEGKFVVMHSGNHSPCHPLDTLMEAARELAGDPRIAFCFVGGGSQFPVVEAFAARHELSNIVCLPYQTLSVLSASLSTADLHVVVMGDAFVGTVHPCKVYNVLALGIPFLYIGPERSHISDLASEESARWMFRAAHGDVRSVVGRILEALDRAELGTAGELSTAVPFRQHHLAGMLADVVTDAATDVATEIARAPEVGLAMEPALTRPPAARY